MTIALEIFVDRTASIEWTLEPLVKDSISLDVTKWTRMAKHCKGVSEETTTRILKSAIGRRVKVCKVLG